MKSKRSDERSSPIVFSYLVKFYFSLGQLGEYLEKVSLRKSNKIVNLPKW
jgi:hypothetical protein